MRIAILLVIAAFVIIPISMFGCKGKVDKSVEDVGMEESIQPAEVQGAALQAQGAEPAQNVAVETIPPSATPPMAEKAAPVAQERLNRDKEIQMALKNAGFYAGTIDGKIGPKSKKAIMEFQKAKGLVADGKVGPKTWAELEKYLSQQ